MMYQETAFRILDIPAVAGSERGIRQSIQPDQNGKIRRKNSGRRYSTARPQFASFRTTVYFEDVWPPAFGGLTIGQKVTIYCAQEILQPYAPGVPPIRPVVEGTLRYLDVNSGEVPEGPDAVHMAFCPILEVFVADWHVDFDEPGKVSTSDIEFAEEWAPGAELDP